MTMEYLHEFTRQVVGKNASGDTKTKYFLRLRDAFWHLNRGDKKAAIHKLRGLRPNDHPLIAWLIEGI
jgi:hypothetical protein